MDSPKGLSFVHDTALAFRVRDGDPTPLPNQFISQEIKLTDAGGRRPDVGKSRFGQSGGL
jgi:hypothetical protein